MIPLPSLCTKLDEDNVRDNQIDDDMLLDGHDHMRNGMMLGSDDDDEYYNGGGRSKPMSHKASVQDIAGQHNAESSISRVEAAFGSTPALDDSVSRVEAAFAEAFGAVPPAPAAPPAAKSSQAPEDSKPQVFEASAFSLGAAVVPLLAPPATKPTRSIGAPPPPLSLSLSATQPSSTTVTPQDNEHRPSPEPAGLSSDQTKEGSIQGCSADAHCVAGNEAEGDKSTEGDHADVSSPNSKPPLAVGDIETNAASTAEIREATSTAEEVHK